MTTIVRDFGRALRAERLKMKGTLGFWLALIAPAVVVGVQALVIIMNLETYRARDPFDAWWNFALQVMVMWSLLMMPLFVTLETALVAQLDHASQGWKHLFSLPVSRGTLYAAKQIGSMALIALSLVALVVLCVLGGLVMRLVAPGVGFEATIPVFDIASFAFFTYMGSWLLISIHTWVAQRWPSFVVASGVGIAMTIIGVIVIQSDYAGVYPWTLPVLVANGFNNSIRPLNILEEGVRPIRELLIGSLGGVAVALLGGWDFIRRDVL